MTDAAGAMGGQWLHCRVAGQSAGGFRPSHRLAVCAGRVTTGAKDSGRRAGRAASALRFFLIFLPPPVVIVGEVVENDIAH